MPRYERFNQLYETIQMVLDKCVKNDQSILWPDKKLWIIENLQILQDKFTNAPYVDMALSFEEKLISQLGDQQPLLWAIIADVYYVYYLPARQLRYETKWKGITHFFEKIPFSMPNNDADIWKPLQNGFCNTGQRYNQKYRQFWLIISFFLELKRTENVDDLLRNRELFKNILDKKMNEFGSFDRAYDIRHALLYLAFPDYYEPIISSRHKEKIAAAFWDRNWGDMPSDPDDAIYEFKQRQKEIIGVDDNPYYFYDPNRRGIWDTTNTQGGNEEIEDEVVGIQDNLGKKEILISKTPLSFTHNR